MKRHTVARAFAQSIIVAGIALSASALAGSEIIKCVDGTGRLTLTDMPCPDGEQALAVPAPQGETAVGTQAEAEPAPQGIAMERFVRVKMAPKQAAPVKRYAAAAGLSLDVETLKTARMNLLLQDSAAQAVRAQRMAGLQ